MQTSVSFFNSSLAPITAHVHVYQHPDIPGGWLELRFEDRTEVIIHFMTPESIRALSDAIDNAALDMQNKIDAQQAKPSTVHVEAIAGTLPGVPAANEHPLPAYTSAIPDGDDSVTLEPDNGRGAAMFGVRSHPHEG